MIIEYYPGTGAFVNNYFIDASLGEFDAVCIESPHKKRCPSQKEALAMGQGVSGYDLNTRNHIDKQKKLFDNDFVEELNKTYQISLPTNPSQLKHIFREGEGHLSDTPANQKKILDVANDKDNYVGESSNNNCTWYSKEQSDGSQVWVKVHGDVISNAGINDTPRKWNDKTGFDRNPNEEK